MPFFNVSLLTNIEAGGSVTVTALTEASAIAQGKALHTTAQIPWKFNGSPIGAYTGVLDKIWAHNTGGNIWEVSFLARIRISAVIEAIEAKDEAGAIAIANAQHLEARLPWNFRGVALGAFTGAYTNVWTSPSPPPVPPPPNPRSTRTTLIVAANPIKQYQTAAFTMTVSSDIGTPTGTVHLHLFKPGSLFPFHPPFNLNVDVALDQNGSAQFSDASLVPGAYSCTASYPGFGLYESSVSSVVHLSVTAYPAGIRIQAQPDPGRHGEVSLLEGITHPTATGTVDFYAIEPAVLEPLITPHFAETISITLENGGRDPFGSHLWVCNFNNANIEKIQITTSDSNPVASPGVVAEFSLNEFGLLPFFSKAVEIRAYGQYVFVSCYDSNCVVIFDPATNAPVGILSTTKRASSCVVDGDVIYVASSNINTVNITPDDIFTFSLAQALSAFPTPATAQGIFPIHFVGPFDSEGGKNYHVEQLALGNGYIVGCQGTQSNGLYGGLVFIDNAIPTSLTFSGVPYGNEFQGGFEFIPGFSAFTHDFTAVEVFGGRIWASLQINFQPTQNWLLKIDPADLLNPTYISLPGTGIFIGNRGLTNDGTYVWATGDADTTPFTGTAIRIDSSDTTVEVNTNNFEELRGCCFDGVSGVWAAVFNGNDGTGVVRFTTLGGSSNFDIRIMTGGGGGGEIIPGFLTEDPAPTFLGTSSIDPSTGIAQLAVSGIPYGMNTLYCHWSGDVHNPAATSNMLPYKVLRGKTTVTLASDINPTDTATTFSITATVTSASGTPTGTVEFDAFEGGIWVNIGTSTLGVPTANQAKLNVPGGTFPAGNQLLRAQYLGDTNFDFGLSDPYTEALSLTSVPTQISGGGALDGGGNVVVSGHVAEIGAPIAVTVGTVTITYNPGPGVITIGPYAVDGSGNFSSDPQSLPSGSYTFTLDYSGFTTMSDNFEPSTNNVNFSF